ncbi:MAG TPA: GIY-YIG nuclease family protein [Verrucomicrobiota bacterium]|nr:GIY-YIG nuclease family protein [Verrucomicrobiota bacterium]HNU49699.1 GIY-YIG nuclease family protein [Verrucomicrobiota bacterium]
MKTGFFYVYILRTEAAPPHFYTGFTENLKVRLTHHNSGGDPHTAKYRPWRIKTAIAFTDREQALAFERYLKSPSGRAFARKRL